MQGVEVSGNRARGDVATARSCLCQQVVWEGGCGGGFKVSGNHALSGAATRRGCLRQRVVWEGWMCRGVEVRGTTPWRARLRGVAACASGWSGRGDAVGASRFRGTTPWRAQLRCMGNEICLETMKRTLPKMEVWSVIVACQKHPCFQDKRCRQRICISPVFLLGRIGDARLFIGF